MTFSGTVTTAAAMPGLSINGTVTKTGSGNANLSEAVAASTSDQQMTYALDVSAVRMFVAMCDVDCTIETNSGSAADDSLVLKANVPYVWAADFADSFFASTDITAIFVTVAGATAGTLHIAAITDATPA